MTTLRFNTKIYKKKAVLKAVKEYKHLAKFIISCVKNKAYLIVKIEDISSDFIDVLADEFCNYVLGETKKCL